MSVKDLEAKLNRRLKEIHRGYAVKNLKRLPTGEYCVLPDKSAQ